MQPQTSQSISWTQQPQPFPAAQMGGTAQAAGDNEEASMEEDTPGMMRSNSAPDLHMMLQVRLASAVLLALYMTKLLWHASGAMHSCMLGTCRVTSPQTMSTTTHLTLVAGAAAAVAANADGRAAATTGVVKCRRRIGALHSDVHKGRCSGCSSCIPRVPQQGSLVTACTLSTVPIKATVLVTIQGGMLF